MSAARNSDRYGLTLVELLVVIAIVTVALSLSIGGIVKAREAAYSADCRSQLKQIALAVQSYEARIGNFPSSNTSFFGTMVQWRVHILPEIGQEPLWLAAANAARQDPRSYLNPPHSGVSAVVRTYGCPSDWRLATPQTNSFGEKMGLSSYLAVGGANSSEPWAKGIFGRPQPVKANEVTDGLSNTLLIGERPPPSSFDAGWWYSAIIPSSVDQSAVGPNGALAIEWFVPNAFDRCSACFGPGRLDNSNDRWHFWSLHAGGANFALADGSVRFFPYSSGPILPTLATMSGTEPVVPLD